MILYIKTKEGDKKMFCGNCGAQMEDGAAFCPECGMKVENKEATQVAQAVKEKKPVNKKLLGVVIAVAAVIVLAVIIISAMPKKIEVNDYVVVEFEGYDTIGEAFCGISGEYDEAIYDALGVDLDNANSFAQEVEYYDAYAAIRGAITCELSETEGLSNGDEIVLTIEVDNETAKKYGVKLVAKEQTIVVEGLEKVEVVDIFEGTELVVDGVAPRATVYVENNSNNSYQNYTYYECVDTEYVENGDKVVVRASLHGRSDPATWVEAYGVAPETVEKTFVVEGVPEYVSALSQISDEDLGKMHSQAEDVYKAYMAQSWGDGETLTSFEYLGNYLLTSKEEWGYDNTLYLIYRVGIHNIYSNDGDTYDKINEVYWFISFENMLLEADGTFTVDLTDYATPGNRVMIESGINNGWWSTKCWYYDGYQTLDELYKNVVTSRLDNYNHEDNVDASAVTSISETTSEENAETSGDMGEGEAKIIFPDSSEQGLSESDIEALSDEDLRCAINELYARHGYIFNDETLNEYYAQFDWYDPQVAADDFSMDLFNEVETENIELLQEERDSRN